MLPAGTQTLSVTFTPTDSTELHHRLGQRDDQSIDRPGSIYILDPTAGGALSLSGNAEIDTTGNVAVDSNSSAAIAASGNASVTAASVQVVGGVSKSGNAKVTKTGMPASTGNPLAELPAPTIPSYAGTPVSESLSGNYSRDDQSGPL